MSSPSSSKSSSGDSNADDVCAICLSHFDSEIGSPELCDHYFCLECIIEWSKNNNSCPQDRTPFFQIFVRKTVGGKIFRKIPIEEVSPPDVPTEINEDITFCQVCGRCDREDVMLLCDGCDEGYHLDCLRPALESVPLEEWFCHSCLPAHQQNQVDDVPLSERVPTTPTRRRLPRTQENERIRERIIRARRSNANLLENEEAASTPSTSRVRRAATTGSKKKKKVVRIRKKRRIVKKRKGGKGKIRKGSKKRVTKRKAKLSSICRKTHSAKARLAEALGLVIAKNKHNPSQQLIKIKKSENRLPMKNAAISKYTYGLPTLSLLGSNSDLDTVELDEFGASLLTAAVRRQRNVDSRTAMIRRKAASMALQQARATRPQIRSLNPSDLPHSMGILDTLIDNQTALHSKSSFNQVMRQPVSDQPNLKCTTNVRQAGTGADENHKDNPPPHSPPQEQPSFSRETEVQSRSSVGTSSATGSQDPTGAQAYLSYLKECNSKSPPTGVPEIKPPKKKKKKPNTCIDDDVDLYSDIEPEPEEEFSDVESVTPEVEPFPNNNLNQNREESPVSSSEELFIDEKPVNTSEDPPISSVMKPSDFEAVSDNDTQDHVEPSPNGSISLSDSNEPENQVTSTTYDDMTHMEQPKPVASIGLDRLETEVISDSEEICFADTEVIEEGEIPTDTPKVSGTSNPKSGVDTLIASSKVIAKASEGDYEEGEIVDDKKTTIPVVIEEDKTPNPPEPVFTAPSEPSVPDRAPFIATAPSPTRNVEPPKEPPPVKKVDVSFKKMSKNLKVRNYRDSEKTMLRRSPGKKAADHEPKFHERSKTHSSRKSKRRKSKTRDREPKRKEMERYSVREMITKKEEERKKKDEFGRDVSLRDVIKSRKSSRRSRSISRKRSRSHSRSKSSRKRGSGGHSSSYRSRPPKKRRRRSRSSSLSYSSSSSSCSSCSSSDSRSSSASRHKPTFDKDKNSRHDRDSTPIKNSITYSEKPTDKQKGKVKVIKLESDKRRKKKKLPVQSKEVFQAGGSIMISVNFSKNEKAKESSKKEDAHPIIPTKVNHNTSSHDNSAPWTNGRPSSNGKRTPLQDEPMWSPENESHLMNDADQTDLDIILLTPPAQEPILISDSDDEPITLLPPDLGKTSSSHTHKNQGPKTPPEPAIKFTLSTKQNLKAICNPLGEEEPVEEPVPSRGPNTPPGPPPESDESYGRTKSPSAAHRSNREAAFSPRPDVYDPFDPTKSPSNSPQEAKITSSDQVDTRDVSDGSSQGESTSPPPPPLPSNPPQIPERPPEPHKPPPEPEVIVVKSNENKIPAAAPIGTNFVSSTNHVKKVVPPKPLPQTPLAVPIEPVIPLAADPNMQQLFARLPPNVASILYPAAIAAAAARQSATNSLLQRPPFPIAPADFSKPPPTFMPLASKNDHGVTPKKKGIDGMDMDLSSPTSPASSDASDIFEPPATLGSAEKTDVPKHKIKLSKGDRFDALLEGNKPVAKSSRHKSSKSRSRTKEPQVFKDAEDDIPTSAVELQAQEKFIKKMQRQERVVEEVKLSLKPYYNKKTITKNDYKDIMKKCVQKVCHNKSGEINPIKVRALVEGYIKKVKYYRKKKNSSPKTSSKTPTKSHKVSSQGLS